MSQQEFCQNCNQKHSCQSLYQQLGRAKTPSVVRKVVVALLLPLIVFIVSLAAFQKFLTGTTDSKQLQSALAFLLALAAAFLFVLITKLISKQFNKNK